MLFSQIELVGFRNYHHESIELGSGLNVATGINGQGKTNLLEALYMLSRGESFRPGKNPVLINTAAGTIAAKISANVSGSYGFDTVSLKISPDKRDLRINDKRVSKPQLSQIVTTVLFSPESLSAIKDGPEQRRRLVDDLLWTTGYEAVDSLRSFQKVLLTRNRLLRDFRKKALSAATFETTLASLDEIYFPVATRLTWERIKALQKISPSFVRAYGVTANTDNVDISVDYRISSESAQTWSYQQIYDALRTRALEIAAAERENGTSLVGPHKHDISFIFAGQDSRYYCSQGQQRALILAFKISQIMYHYEVHRKQPILLLDDVLSELDLAKQERLMFFLKDLKTQILLTTTDLSKIAKLLGSNVTYLHVLGGKIQKG